MTPDQAAGLLLNSARKAYNEKNFPFAASRFREFLQKYGGHKDAPAARYGLALSLLDGPERDYPAAAGELNQLAGNKALPEWPSVLYHLGLAHRGQGLAALALAVAKPAEANTYRETARQRFEEASRHFGAAVAAYTERLPKPTDKGPSIEAEWLARSRCDQADMLLRIGKAKEARDAVTPLVQELQFAKSRYRSLALYHHGFASFLLGDRMAAGKSLNSLAPFTDPEFATHARYLLARTHHQTGERAEAQLHYEAVIAEHDKKKKDAAAALGNPEPLKNDPEEKRRLEQLANGPLPEHVARAHFFLAVLLYENERFAEALPRFQAYVQQFPTSPFATEAQLRQGFCQVQLRQWDEALKVLQPLVDKDARLNDQALFWIGKAQVGKADPANAAAFEQAISTAIPTFQRAADRSNQLVATDPSAKQRRGEALVEMADAWQRIKKYREATGIYTQVLNEKLLPLAREEEVATSLCAAWQLAPDYNQADQACLKFRDTYPKSPLLPAVLFRYAENAYFQALAAAKIADLPTRTKEVVRLNDEALKRYQVIVEKYPEFAQVQLARFGMAMALYRKGEWDKVRPLLEAIPATDRAGELVLVAYYLADLMLRTAPTRADDAVAAGKLEEQLKAAIEYLDSFVAAVPNGPQTADGLLKLGYAHQRLGGLLAKPEEKAKAFADARAAYEQLVQRFPAGPEMPVATFERAKVLALQNDEGGAINEMRRFQAPPLKTAPIAPMACLHLATLLRRQGKSADAATVLDQCRKETEPTLLGDPQRASWVPLLRYHHGVALREADKRPEARAVLDLIVQQTPERPEAAEAALRVGQCLKEEGEKKISTGQAKLVGGNLKPEDQSAARKSIDDGIADVRNAVAYLANQAEQVRQRQPANEARARILYEAAWAARSVAEQEVAVARAKVQQDLWQKRRDEVAKKTAPGAPPPYVPPPEVPLKLVPLQPFEAEARKHYQALIAAFPDININADARFELAELLSDRGEHDAAIALLREALDKEPQGDLLDKVRVRLGNAWLEKSNGAKAIEQLALVHANPKSSQWAQATYRLAEVHLRKDAVFGGTTTLAAANWAWGVQATLLQAFASGPAPHLSALGQALVTAPKESPAEALRLLSLFRDKPELQNVPQLTDRALLRLGYVLGMFRQWEPSRQAYEQVVGRFGGGPWGLEARYGMGWALQNLGRFDDAVNLYSQVTASVATELAAKAQMNIGLCRLAQKRYPEAATALLVVPFTYDYPELSALSLLEAARALAENKQNDQAVKLLERVLRDYPDTDHAEAARKRLVELKKG
jgi:TolA-binding protein